MSASLGAALSLTRVGGAANGTLWGEDGAVFLQGQYDTGYIHTVLLGYDGYLHLVPRTIALVATAFPIDEWAIALSVTCAVVIGLVGAFIGRALSAYGLPRWLASVVGLLLPLAPIGIYECSNVAANIQWFLAAGCFWALLWAPTERRWIVGGCVLTFLTAGSAPLVLTLVPLALLRLAVTSGRDRILPLWFLLGVALQIFTMQHSTREAIIRPDSAAVFLKTSGLRFLVVSWFGKGWGTSLINATGTWAVAIAGAIWLAVLACCYRSGRSVLLLIAGAVGSFLLFAVGTYYNFLPFDFPGGTTAISVVLDGRYLNSPSVIVITTSLAALALARDRNRVALPMAIVIMALATAFVVNDFHYSAPRQGGPTWAAALAKARHSCEKGKGPVVPVGVAPVAEFDMHLPCSQLLAEK